MVDIWGRDDFPCDRNLSASGPAATALVMSTNPNLMDSTLPIAEISLLISNIGARRWSSVRLMGKIHLKKLWLEYKLYMINKSFQVFVLEVLK